MSWFGSRNTAPIVVIPTPDPFDVRALHALDKLAAAVRAASSSVSTEVFSQLRSIDDVLRPLIAHIGTHPVIIDTQLEVEKLVTDYVPTMLSLYLQLPVTERTPGGKADLILREQYATLERSAHALSTRVYRDSISALETNAIFIQNKFGV